MMTIPLHLLTVGESATVEDLGNDVGAMHRLREMGFEPGAEVELLQAGSPCILRVGQQRVALRCDELSQILVTTTTR